MGWLCIFTPQYFIDILQQMGSELRVHAFPWEGRPFCPLGEDKNHMGGGASAGVPHRGACVLQVGACVLRFQHERWL